MGVPGLWKILAPAVQHTTLTELSIVEGFMCNRNGLRAVIVGIDASLWFAQCQNIFKVAHAQAGPHPELRAIFYRLVRLLQGTVIPVFIFDGPDRPSIKRGIKVLRKPHWLTTPTQELITAFRYYWYTAPGEAEAELAQLNARGHIDAVLTDDGDAFVFGATHVIRNPNFKKDGDLVSIYTTKVIKMTPNVLLTRGGFLLIALLGGGDYNEAGLPGCGSKIALQLSRTQLGDSLLNAALSLSHGELALFLDSWRCELRFELANDPKGLLGRKYPKLAASVTNIFPNSDVLRQYTSPATSWSDGGSGPPDLNLSLREPNIGALAETSERLFNWSSALLTKFNAGLWSGVCSRMLSTADPTRRRWDQSIPFNSSAVLSILKVRGANPEKHVVKAYNLRLSIAPLMHDIEFNVKHEFKVSQSDTLVRVWVPAEVVEYSLSRMVGTLSHGAMKQEKKAVSLYIPILAPSGSNGHQHKLTNSQDIIELTSDSDISFWGSHSDEIIDLTSE